MERALDHVPDLVLSDVMMPRCDGFELLTQLRNDLCTSHVPVILLTARADAESRLAGLERGADDYLPKPFDGAELRARIHNLIQTRRRLWETYNLNTVGCRLTLPGSKPFIHHLKITDVIQRQIDNLISSRWHKIIPVSIRLKGKTLLLNW